MRLPLKTLGLHSDEDAPGADTPQDPTGVTSIPPTPTATGAEPEPTSSATESPAKGQPETQRESQNEQHTSWWDSLKGKLNGFKEWVAGAVGSVKAGFSDLIGG